MLCAVIPRKLRTSIAALVLAGLLAACSTPAPSSAAVVDGTDISDEQLADVLPAASFLAKGSQGPCDAGVQTPSAEADCNRFILGLLIQDAAIASYAEENELAPTTTEINETLNEVQTALGGAEEMRRALAEEDGSVDGMREIIRIILTLQAVQEHVVTNVSEDDLLALYEQNKESFATIDAAHILVADRARAEQLMNQVTPDNFAKLAKQYSEDPGSADKGGELGPTPASGLVPEFSEAALAAKPGEIVGPVETQFGWHIIWVKDVTLPTFEEARPQLEAAGADAFGPWMSQRLTDAAVEVNPRYGELDLTTGEIVAPAGAPAPVEPSGPPPPEAPPAP